MKPDELKYKSLKKLIEPIETRTGLGESAAFLVWFLENVYRLDETEARDAVCDNQNDMKRPRFSAAPMRVAAPG